MENIGKIIENLQLDKEELDRYIADSKRNNIKLQLEELRNIIAKQINDENKKIEKIKLDLAKNETKSEQTSNIKNVEYQTITKYGFENLKDICK